jgi:hypothetical protein
MYVSHQSNFERVDSEFYQINRDPLFVLNRFHTAHYIIAH